MTDNLFVCLVLLLAMPLLAQDTRKDLALSDRSNVSTKDVSNSLKKDCPNVNIVKDADKGDFVLDAVRTKSRQGIGIVPENSFDLILSDRDGKLVRSALDRSSLGSAAKDICHAIKTAVVMEVVDMQNLTQSSDARGDSSGGVAAAVVNGTTGRRTHTDSSSLYVIVNGEHALLDCYERRTGCATIGPGKYYGESDGDGIWVDYQMPITHKQMRNHYKIAGSW